MRKLVMPAIALACLLVASSADATRYIFYNVYGDASALLNKPNDVVAVPFGWDAATEASRNSVLNGLGASVSALPSLLYQQSGKWRELRIADQAKPWSWLSVNTALSSTFSVSMLGDSMIAQMVGVQGSMPAPFASAQLLGVSGTTTTQIRSQVANISSGSNRVVVEGGINNFAFGTVNQIVTDYQAIIESIPSSKQVIVIGIIPNDEAQLRISRPNDTQTNAQIAAINAQLVTLCNSYPNCTPALGVMSMTMTGLTIDGLHLSSAASYQAVLSRVIPSL